jgi:hypothetical protein
MEVVIQRNYTVRKMLGIILRTKPRVSEKAVLCVIRCNRSGEELSFNSYVASLCNISKGAP